MLIKGKCYVRCDIAFFTTFVLCFWPSFIQNGCGYARKVKFAHITMRNVANPIVIDQHYYSASNSNRGTPCGTPVRSARQPAVLPEI